MMGKISTRLLVIWLFCSLKLLCAQETPELKFLGGEYYLGGFKISQLSLNSLPDGNTALSGRIEFLNQPGSMSQDLTGAVSVQNAVFTPALHIVSIEQLALEQAAWKNYAVNGQIAFKSGLIQINNASLNLAGNGIVAADHLHFNTALQLVSAGTFSVMDLNINGYLFSGSVTPSDNGLSLSGALKLQNGTAFVVKNLLFNNNTIVSVGSLAINNLTIGSAVFSGDGSFVNNLITLSGDLTLPQAGNATFGINNLVLGLDGQVISADNFYANNLNINGTIFNGNCSFINGMITLNGNLLFTNLNNAQASVTNLQLDKSGKFTSLEQFALSDVNIQGHIFNGQAGFCDGRRQHDFPPTVSPRPDRLILNVWREIAIQR